MNTEHGMMEGKINIKIRGKMSIKIVRNGI